MWPTSRKYVTDRLAGRVRRSLAVIVEESGGDDIEAGVRALVQLEHATSLPSQQLKGEDSIIELLRPPPTKNPLQSLVWDQECTELLSPIGVELGRANEEEASEAFRNGLRVREYIRLWCASNR